MDSFSSYTLNFRPFSPPDQTSSPSNSWTTHQGASDEEAVATVDNSPPKRRAGRTKFRETRHPLYKGVRQRNGGKWVCEVREPFKKSRIWLGTYPTAEMAARAHDVAAMALRGRAACLNFADSVWLLRVPPSGSVKEIQKAAAEAAEAFRPAASRSEVSPSSGEEPEEKSEIDEEPSENARAAALPPTMGAFYMDEEAVFDMPGLLASMAEGLLLSPPPPPPFSTWDDVEVAADVSLWSYSI